MDHVILHYQSMVELWYPRDIYRIKYYNGVVIWTLPLVVNGPTVFPKDSVILHQSTVWVGYCNGGTPVSNQQVYNFYGDDVIPHYQSMVGS